MIWDPSEIGLANLIILSIPTFLRFSDDGKYEELHGFKESYERKCKQKSGTPRSQIKFDSRQRGDLTWQKLGMYHSVNVLWISTKAVTLQLLIRGKHTLFIFLFTLIEAKVVLFPLIFCFMLQIVRRASVLRFVLNF